MPFLKSKIENTHKVNRRYLIIAVASFAVIAFHAGNRSLWLDDLLTILFVERNAGISENLRRILSDAHSNPPGFYAIAYLWLRIAPYGTFWLKLPSIVFTSIGIYMCGKVAEKIKGERAGVFASLLAGTSLFLITEAANGFRSYGLLFLLSALLVWFYLKRMDRAKAEGLSDIIRYGLTMAALIYTHYFGCIVVLGFAIGDALLLLKRKISWKILISYAMAGLLFLPFLLYALPRVMNGLGSSDVPVPTVQTLESLILGIFSGHELLLACFLFAAVAFIARKTFPAATEDAGSGGRYFCLLLTGVCVFAISLAYIYCRYVGLDGKYMWTRYFISILPMALAVSAIGIDMVLASLNKTSFRAVFALLALLLGVRAIFSINAWSHQQPVPWEQAIDWIYEQHEAHEPGSYIMGHSEIMPYYLTHGGQRAALNVIDEWHFFNTGMEEAPWFRLYCFNSSEGAIQSLAEGYDLVDEKGEYKVLVYQRKAKEPQEQ